jgi:hypothetical protein
MNIHPEISPPGDATVAGAIAPKNINFKDVNRAGKPGKYKFYLDNAGIFSWPVPGLGSLVFPDLLHSSHDAACKPDFYSMGMIRGTGQDLPDFPGGNLPALLVFFLHHPHGGAWCDVMPLTAVFFRFHPNFTLFW